MRAARRRGRKRAEGDHYLYEVKLQIETALRMQTLQNMHEQNNDGFFPAPRNASV